MIEALPRRAFFSFELPIRYVARTPALDGHVDKWSPDYLVPPLVTLEGEEPFADVYWAWNEDYFFLAVDVPNRRGRLHCDAEQWWKYDGLRLCLDTRDVRSNKRATRFCHFFYFLPTGGGPARRSPIAGTHRMSRALEPPPPVDTSRIKLGVRIGASGYALEAAVPTDCLFGWDPLEHARLGIFYKVKDTVLGAQHLTVTDELGWNTDPSTWATGVLVR